MQRAVVILLLVSAVARAEDKAADDDKWKDAAPEAIIGDLTIFVGTVRGGKAPIRSSGRLTESNDDLLTVYLGIRNTNDTTKLNYRGWSTKTFDLERAMAARASDEFGNAYKRIDFGLLVEVEGQLQRGESIYPGKTLVDVLVFERPIDKAKELRFLLPGEAVDRKEPIRLKVPIRSQYGVVFDYATEQKLREIDEKKAVAAEKKKADAEDRAKTKPERDVKLAAGKLKAAKDLAKQGKGDASKRMLKEILEKYPDTEAAKEAEKLLK